MSRRIYSLVIFFCTFLMLGLVGGQAAHALPVQARARVPQGFIASIHGDTKTSIERFAHAWANSREQEQQALLAESYVVSHSPSKLDGVSKKWLRLAKQTDKQNSYVGMFKLYSESRVSFYEKTHNWNTPESTASSGVTYTGPVDTQSNLVVHTYGFNVLRSMTSAMNRAMIDLNRSPLSGEAFQEQVVHTLSDIMIDIQATVHDDELRFYINQVVWHATNETTKQRLKLEPSGSVTVPKV